MKGFAALVVVLCAVAAANGFPQATIQASHADQPNTNPAYKTAYEAAWDKAQAQWAEASVAGPPGSDAYLAKLSEVIARDRGQTAAEYEADLAKMQATSEYKAAYAKARAEAGF